VYANIKPAAACPWLVDLCRVMLPKPIAVLAAHVGKQGATAAVATGRAWLNPMAGSHIFKAGCMGLYVTR
jgi:hypothetical protein